MSDVQAWFSNDDLRVRALSSLVLMPFALLVTWAGGNALIIAVTISALLIYREWNRLVRANKRDLLFWIFVALIILAGTLLLQGNQEAAIAIWIGAFAFSFLPVFSQFTETTWALRGLFYALCILIPLVLLRESQRFGFEVSVFILVVVWATDIFSYLCGTLIGGPKLAPLLSPKKTWAGFLGGLTAGTIAAMLCALSFGFQRLLHMAFVGLVLALAAQGGDLFESFIKRRFHAKDSGTLIPGHGGLLDRLDSLIAAGLVAYLLGTARTGFFNSAEGLLLW